VVPGRLRSTRVHERGNGPQGEIPISLDIEAHELAAGKRPFGELTNLHGARALGEQQVAGERRQQREIGVARRAIDGGTRLPQPRGQLRSRDADAVGEHEQPRVEQRAQALVVQALARAFEDGDGLTRLAARHAEREAELQSHKGTRRLVRGQPEGLAQQLHTVGLPGPRGGHAELQQQCGAVAGGRRLALGSPEELRRRVGRPAGQRGARRLPE
jgi:hypothetical protein